ncbi:type ISP restriction/modification enzyme [Saccharomonospora saliphila]|uniref:type ISP restriction/modification enzyme n=1 Tax=Saccharomonospora saliphila TaxID=369829 RepID=UPI0003A20762|nr:type ISP restriction/modification enzyme [Saccharomonospora saliphila]
MPDTVGYQKALRKVAALGTATEHSYRPALKSYVESYIQGVDALNEPRRVVAGAPDYDVIKNYGGIPRSIGKIEAKDLGAPLIKVIRDSDRSAPRTALGRQLRRYRDAFDNLLFTNYLDFYWFRNGELQQSVSIGTYSGGKLSFESQQEPALERIIGSFLNIDGESVTSAKHLAERMAKLTAVLDGLVSSSLERNTASDEIQSLKKAFETVLVPNLTTKQFADMFAQTLAYGLFAARVNYTGPSDKFVRSSAATAIPRTNPFLRKLFALIAGPTLDDEPFVGIVDDIATLLAYTDMSMVLRDFGSESRADPVVHFYETFLSEYDPELREVRGVYYTPQPVVNYIVRSIDRVLIQEFSLVEGLADTSKEPDGSHKVLLLDPACGTGTFLYGVVDLVRERIREMGSGFWSAYVRDHLLPRLYGFEVMMAPYAVAHMKMGMQIGGLDLPEHERSSLAYDLDRDDRFGIYLTNALDASEKQADILFGQFVSTEANAASEVKKDRPIMVVLGNPPYQGQSVNPDWRLEKSKSGKRGQKTRVPTFIGKLLESYFEVDGEPLGEQNPKWLRDDYVKFIRFGQWRVEETGKGVLAFVTNHSYLDSPTFRGMREKLARSFDDIYILNMHGSLRRREKSPDGSVDENVFDQIQQGTAIAIFVKKKRSGDLGRIHYNDMWGTRSTKYDWLSSNTIDSTSWETFVPSSPFYSFRPEDADVRKEWESALSLIEIFPTYSTGIVTHRDSLVVDTREERLRARIDDFCNPAQSVDEVRAKYFGTKSRTTSSGVVYQAGDNRDWQLNKQRPLIQSQKDQGDCYVTLSFRPFDNRSLFYCRHAIDSMKYEVMQHMLKTDNIGLVSARSNKSSVQDQFFVSEHITEVKLGEATTGSVLFPLWVISDDDGTLFSVRETVTANISAQAKGRVKDLLDFKFLERPHGDLESTIGAEDFFSYVYAIVYSRGYRVRYADFLRKDYAHIPITSDKGLFRDLCRVGSKLSELHRLRVAVGSTSFPVSGTNEIAPGFPRWIESGDAAPDGRGEVSQDRLYLNRDGGHNSSGQYFSGVSQEMWEFRVGGHQVLSKWLKSRQGDSLTYDELRNFQRVCSAISRTIELMDELDVLVPAWPIT